tara:strand:+ start:109 stop:690 length:582 start_codon:yes stop_codon:yes gene_type:complete
MSHNLENHIKIFNSTMPIDCVSTMIRVFNKYCEFKDARTIGNLTGDYDNFIRNNQLYDLSIKDKSLSIVHWTNYLHNYILKCVKEYENRGHYEPGIASQVLDISVLKYGKGNFYKPHIDHCASIPRTLSFIMFLNNDYKGGELEFYTPDKSKSILTVKPEVGKTIVWPSTFLYPHAAKPVIEGERLVIVSWIL